MTLINALQAQWAALSFAWPWLWLVAPLPLLMSRLSARPRRATALKVPYSALWLSQVAQSTRGRGLHVSRLLLWGAWLLLCTAAARPQQLGDAVEPPRQARQMMLAVDLSGSMSEADMQLGGQVVERLTAAKAVLADFLERRQGDRVGLLVFGQRAYTLTPLTADLASVRAQLRDSVVGLAGRETALGDAIGLSVKRLRDQPEGQRVVIVLTDGVNTAGVLEPLKAAELAKAEGVRVHTIAFGGQGGISLFGMRLPMAEDPIDEDTLQQVAKQTGGRFFRARDTAELAGIYAELDRLEPVQIAGEAIRPRLERYYVPLLLSLLLAGLSWGWPGQRQ